MNQPMAMPGQNPIAPMTHSPMSTNMDTNKVNQSNNVAQGVQFVRKIQQRISEIEQKLSSPMSDAERSSLQRAHQELTRLQTTLLQKISQGVQMPASPGPSNMTPSVTAQNMSTFTPSTFANATPSKLGTNVLGNQSGSMPQAQPTIPMPAVQHAQASNISITPEQFKRTLSELMRRHGKSLPAPVVDGREVDLYQLFSTVQSLGGSKAVTKKNMWSSISIALGFISVNPTQQASIVLQFAQIYKNYLELFEDVWNRAMLHQLSMGRSNPQMVHSNLRTEGNAIKSMAQPQTAQPRPPNYAVMHSQQSSQPQAQQTTARVSFPFTKEQLGSLNLSPEQMAQLLQQQSKPFTPAMPQSSNQNVAGSQSWTPAQQHIPAPPQTRATEPTKRSTNKSPDKQRWQPLAVTPKMLEDAEGLIRKIELSLNVSRPKLPVIESMTESEKSSVLQQMEKLIPLKTTVSALLPAFLAMSRNIEPAKRVKIMVYMFEDQLALLPKRQCILRPSDLEKLKIQMTRCIGFVRMNDDKLAQRIMAKTLASQQKGTQGRNASDDPRRSNVFSESNKKAKKELESNQQGSLEVNQHKFDSSKSRGNSQTSGDVSSSKASRGTLDIPRPTSSDTKSATGAGSPGMELSSEQTADAVGKTLDIMMADHRRNIELAQSDPLQFVQKAWSNLLSIEEAFAKQTSFIDLPTIDDKPIGDRRLWAPVTIEAAIMDMIDAPSVCEDSEADANYSTMTSTMGGSITIGSQNVLQLPQASDVASSNIQELSKASTPKDRANRFSNNTSSLGESDWWQIPIFASTS